MASEGTCCVTTVWPLCDHWPLRFCHIWMWEVLGRDSGQRVYFPVLGMLESGLSNSTVSYADRYCEGGGDENDQRDGWNRERWQGEDGRSNVVTRRMRKGEKHDMQEGDGEKVTVETEGWTMGQERIEVDVTGGKMKGRKEVRVDMSKGKPITGMTAGRKEAGKKGTTEKVANRKDIYGRLHFAKDRQDIKQGKTCLSSGG